MRAGSLIDMVLLAIPLLEGAATRRAAPKILRIAIFGILSGILAGAIFLALFYAGYSVLGMYGFTPLASLLLMILVAIGVLLGCIAVMRRTMKEIKHAAPSTEGLNRLVDAFLDGLGTSTPRK